MTTPEEEVFEKEDNSVALLVGAMILAVFAVSAVVMTCRIADSLTRQAQAQERIARALDGREIPR